MSEKDWDPRTPTDKQFDGEIVMFRWGIASYSKGFSMMYHASISFGIDRGILIFDGGPQGLDPWVTPDSGPCPYLPYL